MKNDEIIFKIDKNQTPLKEFKELSDAFFEIIEAVSRNVCGGGKCLEQFISVEKGSAVLKSSIMAKTPEDEKYSKITKDAVINGLKVITNDKNCEMPEFFDSKILNLVHKIGMYDSAKIIENNNEEINFTKETASNVVHLLQGAYTDIGSVEGIVTTITIKGGSGLRITLKELLHNYSVKCSFINYEVEEKAKFLIGKRVCGYGDISYDKNGIPLKIKIKDITELKSNNLPTWEDVRGILSE